MAKTYDPACYALAEKFLADEPALNTEAAKITLAAVIQECIEDEIEFMRSQLDLAEWKRATLATIALLKETV